MAERVDPLEGGEPALPWALLRRISFHPRHRYSIFIGHYARQFHEVHPGSNVPGGIGYLFLLAMKVTSFDRTAALLGIRVWQALHATVAFVLWTIFLISDVSRVHEDRGHLLFIVPLLLVLAIRILAWWRSRAVSLPARLPASSQPRSPNSPWHGVTSGRAFPASFIRNSLRGR